MRIMYLSPAYWPSMGGAQLYARELARRMLACHGVAVVTQRATEQPSYAASLVACPNEQHEDQGMPVFSVGPSERWQPVLGPLARMYGRPRLVNPVFAALLRLALRPQLSALVDWWRPDVIHAIHMGLVYSAEAGLEVAHKSGIPLAWTPFAHIEGGGWSGPRFRRLYQRTDALVAMTRREKDWLANQGASPQRVHVLPAGPLMGQPVDPASFRKRCGLGDYPVVLFLAQKLAYKGYAQMVAAAPLVWSERPDVRFVFAGPRSPASVGLFSTITDERVVELPALMLPEEKSTALAACDVFCMPSTQESLGMVYLEAWCYQKPVVAADIKVTRELIADGEDGLLVEQEPHAIAAALLRLIKDSGLAARLGQAGFAKVQQQYSWEKTVAGLEQVYRQIAAGTAA